METEKRPVSDRRNIIRDKLIPGLHLRIFPDRKSYYLYYRTKTGIERRPKLGDVGTLTLADARSVARKILVEVAAGGDPVADRKAAKAAPTMRELADRYMLDHGDKKKTGKEDRRLFDRIILPALGSKRVPDVQYEDVKRLHDRMSATPYQANRVLALLSKVFHLAERPWMLRPLNSNPCQGIKRYREYARRRFASPHELATIGTLLEREAAENPAGVAYLHLLALSGARPSEIERATWDQFDRVTRDGVTAGVLRISEGKTGDRTVFLPPQAVAILARLPRVDGETITGITAPRKLWERIRTEAGCPDLRMRDLRRTFGVIGLSGGLSAGAIGELLGHRSSQTTKRYIGLIENAAHIAAEETASQLQRMLAPSVLSRERE